MASVDVMVFTYNNEDIICRCLDSIKRQSFQGFRCVVIDDGSDDNTVGVIKKGYKWVSVYKKPKNTGPASSRNIGIRKTRGEYIVMLDSDVELKKDWLKEQMRIMKDRTIGVAGGKLLYANNHKKINSAGGCITRLGFGFDRGNGRNAKSYNECEDLMYVCSAACIIRRSILNDVGLFDGTFFYPHEDTDFCWRVNLCGHRVVYNPKAIAFHNVGETTGGMSNRVAYHVTKNRIRSVLKNYGLNNIIKYLPVHLSLVLFDILIRNNKIPKLRGVLWNMISIRDTLNERGKVQGLRTVSDRGLKGLFSDKWVNDGF